MNDGNLLLIFVRFPERGVVKTRLIGDLGEERALSFYRSFVADTIVLAHQTGYPSVVFFHPPETENQMVDWLGHDLVCEKQQGHDLGERMYGAFEKAFTNHGRVVLIGSDCPDLPPDILHEAFAALRAEDAVIGPSYDGGYYLIGFASGRLLQAPFCGIPWGSNRVYDITVSILKENSLRVHVLPQWHDIDIPDDLEAFRSRHKDLSPGMSMTLDSIMEQLRR
jgi:uncharacterized protein